MLRRAFIKTEVMIDRKLTSFNKIFLPNNGVYNQCSRLDFCGMKDDDPQLSIITK